MTLETLARFMAPLRARVVNMVARAVLQLVDDSKKMQIVQLQLGEDESRNDIERVQNYGFTSNPKPGAEAAVIFVAGRRDHGLAIAIDDRRYRLTNLVSGEVAMYTDQGDSIVIKRGGDIEITGAAKVVLNTPDVELAGNTEAAVNGTTYRAAEDTLLGLVKTAANLMAPGVISAPAAAAWGAVSAGVDAFKAAESGYVSTKVKLS